MSGVWLWGGQIKKKQTDLERGEKRLKSLQTVRYATHSSTWVEGYSPHIGQMPAIMHSTASVTSKGPSHHHMLRRPVFLFSMVGSPAFMDEYEKLEKELQRQYEIYLGRFRNIEYLEHELDLYHQVQPQTQRAGKGKGSGRGQAITL